ncbi:hypothetical protein HK097_010321 [Rhizophlyctis rosea]|uniref:RZZ complex subunit KNTC1/ROD C-terminal domain-containing protein n=1 Tax=Rhizophlyctis rosea TaxID=64517 RepID=A0AAD5SA14_9FUNG|nr:hypothetical protein HK097_010321 [Rhizophlyctis rosea]
MLSADPNTGDDTTTKTADDSTDNLVVPSSSISPPRVSRSPLKRTRSQSHIDDGPEADPDMMHRPPAGPADSHHASSIMLEEERDNPSERDQVWSVEIITSDNPRRVDSRELLSSSTANPTSCTSLNEPLATGSDRYLINSSEAQATATAGVYKLETLVNLLPEVSVSSNEIGADMKDASGDAAAGKKTFAWLGFADRAGDEAEELLVVLKNLIMFRFSNINLGQVADALLTQNFQLAMEVKKRIVVEQVDLTDGTANIQAICDVVPWIGQRAGVERIVLAGTGDHALTVWQRSTRDGKTKKRWGVGRLLAGCEVVRADLDPTSKYLVVLDSDRRMTVWDFRSLLMIHCYENTGIVDFVVMQQPVAAGQTDARKFKIAALVDVSSGDHNEVHVESMAHPDYNRDHNLAVRALSETLPMNRFQQLISCKRFEDADAFAKQHSLDEQIVARAKLNHTLNELGIEATWNGDELTAVLQGVWQDLDKVNDLSICIDFCLRVVMPTARFALQMLTYARDLISRQEGSYNQSTKEDAVQKVYGGIRRLGTYQLIHANPASEDEVDDEAGEFDGKEWQRFRTSDMVAEMRDYVRVGNLRAVIVIWRRHHLDENLLNKLPDILADLPDHASPSDFVPWLGTEVLPFIAAPEDRSRLAEWIERRARITEQKQSRPHGALSVIRLLDTTRWLANPAGGTVSAGGEMQLFSPATPARYVENTALFAQAGCGHGQEEDQSVGLDGGLRAELEDLVYLWDKHDFQVSLSDYTLSTPIGIALELLDRVAAPELIRDAVDMHFRPYVERNNLTVDELLVEYCVELMDGTSGSAGSHVSTDTLWEARVLAVLSCVSSVDCKLDVVLELMKRITVPWSEAVAEVFGEALGWKAVKRGDELREQYQLLRLKKMLLGYGIENFNISDKSLAKGLLRKILSRTDLLHAMDDALQVVNAYHHLSKINAFRMRIINLCEAGLVDRALKLLRFGQEDKTADMEDVQASESVDNMESRVPTLDALEAVEAGMEALYHLNEVMEEAVEFADEFAFALQEEFGVMMSLRKYADLVERRRVLNQFAARVFTYEADGVREVAIGQRGKGKGRDVDAMDVDGNGPKPTQTSLYRLAEVLGFERSNLKGLLAEQAARNGDFRNALLMCKELYDKFPDASTARILKRIAHFMTAYASQNKQVYRDAKEAKVQFRLTSRIVQLSEQALATCGEDIIQECLDDFKNYELQHSVFAQCDAGDYATLSMKENSHPSGKLTNRSQAFGARAGPTASGSSSLCGRTAGASSTSSGAKGDYHGPEEVQTAFSATAALPLETEVANIRDTYASSLFEEHFHRSGLVLPTESAMEMVAAFVLDAALSATGAEKEYADLAVRRSGKAKGAERAAPEQSGKRLTHFLLANGNLTDALRALHRAEEAKLRYGRVKGADDDDEDSVEMHRVILQKLLQNVLSSKFIDQRLGLGCMMGLPQEMAFEAYRNGLGTTNNDYSRLVRIAPIGIVSGMAWKQMGLKADSQRLAANGRWWHQLRLLDIPFDHAEFQKPTNDDYRRGVVPQLLQRTGLDLLTALEYAQSYNIEDDYIILEYILQLLLPSPGNRDASGFGYQTRVAGVIDDVANRDKLLMLLKDQCLPKISSYDYERIKFILSQILRLQAEDEVTKRAEVALDILLDYSRVTPPDFAELLEAKKGISSVAVVPDNENLTDLQQDPWAVLRAELSEDSITRLLALSVPLKLPSDDMYTVVIENMMERRTGALDDDTDSPPSNSNSPSPVPTTLRTRFAEVKPFIMKLRDESFAIKMAVMVGGQFSCGPERISAYKTALHFAERKAQKAVVEVDAQAMPGEVPAAHVVARLKAMLQNTETEDQLRSLGLLDVLPYVKNQADRQDSLALIERLYLVKSEQALESKVPFDLHGLVNDICKRYSLPDPEIIRAHLARTWLGQEVHVGDEQRETYLSSMRMQLNNLANSKEEMSIQKRLLYLLRYGPVQKSITLLTEFAYQPSAKILTLNRVRALSVLFQLAGPADLEEVGVNHGDVKKYMQMLLYLADFEELRIIQSLRDFGECDKEALARSLWLYHRDKPKVVQLICNICLDYNIHDLTLWDSALRSLQDRRLYRYLLGLLEHFTSIPELAQMEYLPQLWNDVMLECLKLFVDGGETAVYIYGRVISLLQKCPFLAELDVHAFIAQFRLLADDVAHSASNVEKVIKALRGLASLPPVTETTKALHNIVQSLPSESLMKVLDCVEGNVGDDELVNQGAVDLFLGKRPISQAIYDTIDSQRAYQAVIGTKHLEPFVRYLVTADRVEHILVATLRTGRVEGGLDLVEMYYREWPDYLKDESEGDEVVDENEDEGRRQRMLKVYLRTHKFDAGEAHFVQLALKRLGSGE